jgi:hypothetical protein
LYTLLSNYINYYIYWEQDMKNKILVAAITALFIPVAQATTYGTDVNNTVLPATGGMAGASIARTVEGAAAVFGNPANLTQYKEGTTFSFGATFFDPTISETVQRGQENLRLTST